MHLSALKQVQNNPVLAGLSQLVCLIHKGINKLCGKFQFTMCLVSIDSIISAFESRRCYKVEQMRVMGAYVAQLECDQFQSLQCTHTIVDNAGHYNLQHQGLYLALH